MSRATLTGANLITAYFLSDVIWNETACPRGGKSSTGCSPFATVPGPGYPPQTGQTVMGPQWYQFRSIATAVLPSTPLLGTPDAPIIYRLQRVVVVPNDGVQGMIKNDSGQRILVRTRYLTSTPGEPGQEAILEPGTEMPYQLWGPGFGELEFYLAPEGKAASLATRLAIRDNAVSLPDTAFTPPGALPRFRYNWKTEESHYEIWGQIRLWVKRERDGYTVPYSEDYKRLYGDPNSFSTSDWAIFTIRIESL
jgi:hypothetical protein